MRFQLHGDRLVGGAEKVGCVRGCIEPCGFEGSDKRIE